RIDNPPGLQDTEDIIQEKAGLDKLFRQIGNRYGSRSPCIGPRRIAVDVQKGSHVSVAVDPVVRMADSIRSQDADIEPVFLLYHLMVPLSKVNVKVKAGHHFISPIHKSDAHKTSPLSAR